MLFINTNAFAEEDYYSLEPSLANAMGYTAEQWFQSEQNRALLTVILGLEYSSYDTSFDISCLYTNTSYVIYAEEYPALMVCMLTENKTYTIMYVPWLKMAVIPDSADVSSEKASEMLFEIQGYQYKKNSKEALSDAVTSVNGFIDKIME